MLALLCQRLCLAAYELALKLDQFLSAANDIERSRTSDA